MDSAPQTVKQISGSGDTREGFLFALSAYLLWGFLPLYLKAVSHIPVLEVLAHRILWSVPVAGIVLIWLGRTADIRAALRSPKMMAQAILTSAIIAVNWGVYVWAISADRTVEAALGYYINPLFSVFLAAVFLGERLDRLQMLAILFALAAVAVLTIYAGGLPWVALALSLTWGFYALFKKTLPIGPTQGFFMEVALLSPPAFAFAVWLASSNQSYFLTTGWWDAILLAFAGLATGVPLILYANGAKLLRLSTIGIMQYIAPSLIFLVAIFIFREPFDVVRLFAFILIWIALVLYSVSLLRQRNKRNEKAATGSPSRPHVQS